MTTKLSKPTKSLISVPIELLQNDVARVYTHVHPILVLTSFYASFKSIVADPVSSLASLIIPLCVAQAVYAAICLPIVPNPAITHPSTHKTGSQQPQTQQPRRKPGTSKTPLSFASKFIPTVLANLLSLVLGAPIITIILILHGAPLTSHLPHTFLAGTHLSLLSTSPLFYTRGVSSAKWRELVSLSAPIDELTGAALGVVVGAWLGAVPIPLDWDREWQKWPITVVAGAYAGWAAGKLLGATLLKGKRIEFDE